MAINYGNYAQNYAGRTLDLSGINRALSEARNLNKERAHSDANQFLSNFMNTISRDYQNLSTMDIGHWVNNGLPDFLNSGEAYAKFRNQVDNLPSLQRNFIYSSGLMDPLAFKQQFSAMKSQYIPMFEKKLETYKIMNGLNNKESRDFVKSVSGLQKFLLSNGSPEGIMRQHAMPYYSVGENIKDWWQDDWGLGKIAGVGAGGAASIWAAKKAAQGIMNRGSADVAEGALPAFTKGQDPFGIRKAQEAAKRAPKQYLQGLGEGEWAKTRAKRLAALGGAPAVRNKAATEAINEAFPKIGKGKWTQNMLKNPGSWKNILKSAGMATAITTGAGYGTRKIAKALGADEKGQEVAGAATNATLSSIALTTNQMIKKKGLPWVLSKITKKAGAGLALRLGAKLGIGLVGGIGTGGLATAAMAGWAMKDIYDLYQAIQSVSQEAGIGTSTASVTTTPKANLKPFAVNPL